MCVHMNLSLCLFVFPVLQYAFNLVAIFSQTSEMQKSQRDCISRSFRRMSSQKEENLFLPQMKKGSCENPVLINLHKGKPQETQISKKSSVFISFIGHETTQSLAGSWADLSLNNTNYLLLQLTVGGKKTKPRSMSGQENTFRISAAMRALLFFCQLLHDD